MTRFKKSAFLVCVLVMLFSLLSFQTSLAQDFLSVYEVFPQRGGLGETVSLLLRGDGFESIGSLDAVLASGSELEVRAIDILSNDLMEVQVFIPQNTPLGITEIRFIFDDNAYDAYFEVTEGGEGSISPVISELYPRDGQRDTDLSLFLEVFYLFDGGEISAPRYEWGEFVDMIIGGVEVTVYSIEISESGELWEYRIYLPPETPVGETEISIYYENFSFRDFFLVTGPQEPIINAFFPNQSTVDTELEFILEGENLSGLGELQRVEIAGRDVPIRYSGTDSNEVAYVGVYLPPDLPGGDTGIVFIYENYGFEDAFFIVRAGEPVIRRVSPREAEANTEIEFILEGENLFELGELERVEIAGRDVPVQYSGVDSNELAYVGVFVPPEMPAGSTGMVFFYENYAAEFPVNINRVDDGGDEGRQAILRDLSPREGEIDSEFDLYLEGENFYELGELVGVSIDGVDLEVLEYDVESEEDIWVYVYMPYETPLGQQRITFYFENGEFRQPFTVSEPDGEIPIEILIGGGVLVLGGMGVTSAVLIRRAINKNKQTKDQSKKPLPDYRFEVQEDPGVQTVRPERSSLTLDWDLTFEVEGDPGEQNIAASGNQLIADE